MRYYFLALGTIAILCVGCVGGGFDGQQAIDKGDYYAPPAARLQRPGPMVDGPGPGVISTFGAPAMRTFATQSTQIRIVGPPGMQIGWKIPQGFAENQLTAPGRYNFRQGATYRLKMTNVPGRDGLILYPSLNVYPSHPTTDAYLAHNSVPLEVTDEDLDQVESNNFVTKVIYLPDPRFQELAIAGVETLVSTRLDPGVDPVAEADKRGTIMAVLRVGNMDLEMPDNATPPNGAAVMPDGTIQQISHIIQIDGEKGQHVPPMPIAGSTGEPGVPGPMLMGMAHGMGQPPYNPITGAPGGLQWGMASTSTPIGLPGPPHLPFGGPASLKSHTMRNQTDVRIPDPVEHFLIDVKHKPGIRMPPPVRHVQYEEKHPTFNPGELNYPKYSLPPQPMPVPQR